MGRLSVKKKIRKLLFKFYNKLALYWPHYIPLLESTLIRYMYRK